MPTWLKKIALDIMPSVAATIIGAYIVNYYIIPKSPLWASRAAIASTDSKPADGQPADVSASDKTAAERPASDKASSDKVSSDKAALDKSSFEKAVADKTAIEKTAEKAASDKAAADKASSTAAIEPRKFAKPPAKAASVAATEPVADDRRTTNARATDLARAAIDRLRGNGHSESAKPEPARSDLAKAEPAKSDFTRSEATAEPSKTSEVPRIQTVSTIATPTIPPMQPLPPAMNVVGPNSDVFDQGTAVPVMRQPLPRAALRSEDRGRLSPPGSIPMSRPIDLRADASVSDRTSVADDVMSAARSMFHAVIPR